VNGEHDHPSDVSDEDLVAAISARAADWRRRIAELTDREVRLVAVTKGHPIEVALAAASAGFDDLGENYAQELLAKVAAWPTARPAPRWHFIGRLQSNKVRQLAGHVALWQTVDRASLASEIARRDPGAQVLVQLDLAGIEGRGGCAPGDAPALVEHCRGLGLDVRGLMGVGVPGPPEESRPGFRLLDSMATELGLSERSMGMSGDAEVALSEGATIIRIGSALVGPRVVPPRAG
jgi:pyridoxal phosphate enzyme (YggS family)